MEEETFGNEISKKKSTIEDVINWIPEWIPGVAELREQKKRVEGTSTKKTKKETSWGEYE